MEPSGCGRRSPLSSLPHRLDSWKYTVGTKSSAPLHAGSNLGSLALHFTARALLSVSISSDTPSGHMGAFRKESKVAHILRGRHKVRFFLAEIVVVVINTWQCGPPGGIVSGTIGLGLGWGLIVPPSPFPFRGLDSARFYGVSLRRLWLTTGRLAQSVCISILMGAKPGKCLVLYFCYAAHLLHEEPRSSHDGFSRHGQDDNARDLSPSQRPGSP